MIVELEAGGDKGWVHWLLEKLSVMEAGSGVLSGIIAGCIWCRSEEGSSEQMSSTQSDGSIPNVDQCFCNILQK